MAGIAHVHRITRPGCVVDETSAVAGPVEFGRAIKIGSWLSTQDGAPQMLMSAWFGPAGLRVQNVTRAPSGEKPSVRTDGLTSSRCAAACQVVKLTAANLGHPHVHLPVAICEEGHESPVTGDRGRLLNPVEVGKLTKSGIRQWILQGRARRCRNCQIVSTATRTAPVAAKSQTPAGGVAPPGRQPPESEVPLTDWRSRSTSSTIPRSAAGRSSTGRGPPGRLRRREADCASAPRRRGQLLKA